MVNKEPCCYNIWCPTRQCAGHSFEMVQQQWKYISKAIFLWYMFHILFSWWCHSNGLIIFFFIEPYIRKVGNVFLHLKLQITYKINSIHSQYTVNSEVLFKVTYSKYLRGLIDHTQSWMQHIREVTNKANKVKGFLQCNLWSLQCRSLVLSGHHTHKRTYISNIK